jgi:hypothetical protein
MCLDLRPSAVHAQGSVGLVHIHIPTLGVLVGALKVCISPDGTNLATRHTLYQFIFIFASISVWKFGTSRSSLPADEMLARRDAPPASPSGHGVTYP